MGSKKIHQTTPVELPPAELAVALRDLECFAAQVRLLAELAVVGRSVLAQEQLVVAEPLGHAADLAHVDRDDYCLVRVLHEVLVHVDFLDAYLFSRLLFKLMCI